MEKKIFSLRVALPYDPFRSMGNKYSCQYCNANESFVSKALHTASDSLSSNLPP